LLKLCLLQPQYLYRRGGGKVKMKKDSKGTKDKIIELFYIEHKKPTEIAKELNVVNSYVTKIIQKDERYFKEKEYRTKQSEERHKACKRNYINKIRQADKQSYQTLLIQINKDNEYLSTKNEISDLAFAKWNRGMYIYDKNSSDLILNKKYNVGYNVAKRVRDIINPNCIKATV